MPARPKQKDNVSKNMGGRYSTLEPWNQRAKPHTVVIDVRSRSQSSSTSTVSYSDSHMEWQSPSAASSGVVPQTQGANDVSSQPNAATQHPTGQNQSASSASSTSTGH